MERQVSQGQSRAREQASQPEVRRHTPTLITQATLDRLTVEYEELKQRAFEVTKDLAEVKANEDGREQGARELVLKTAAEVGKRTREIEPILNDHLVINPRKQINDVRRGNTVSIKLDGADDFSLVTLVGSPEDAKTNPDWTYYDSPIGKAIIRKKKGERFTFILGSKKPQVEKAGVIEEIYPGQFAGPRESQNPQTS